MAGKASLPGRGADGEEEGCDQRGSARREEEEDEDDRQTNKETRKIHSRHKFNPEETLKNDELTFNKGDVLKLEDTVVTKTFKHWKSAVKCQRNTEDGGCSCSDCREET
ncbi:hypothetical protein N1851_032621 [Merluccius polli]|uniref:Uncharacterized protein n=1 Tax=Merluccius polli TaxID=89951 RepID=A0AA47M2V4_MERPO|nr:hypothetical protein N1851_032621 [Merluccius polli]